MASPRQQYSRGTLVFSSITAIICIGLYSNMIHTPSYQKSGIITVLFDFPNINLRSIPLSIPTDPAAVSAIPGQAQSVASVAATAVSSIASEAQSGVSSAIATVETAIGSVIPKNCSLGLEKFSVGFTNHVDPGDLPLNISKIIPNSVITLIQPSNLETVNRALAVFNPRSVKYCLIIGLTFAILTILPDVLYICSVLAHQLGLIPLFLALAHRVGLISLCCWISQMSGLLRIGSSSICAISTLIPASILFDIMLKAKYLPQGATMEIGEAGKQALAGISCAILMWISSIVWMIIEYNLI